MGDIFKTLTAGFSRFVLAWLVPSLATLAVFAVYIYPEIKGSGVIRPIFEIANVGKIQAGLVFSFSAILLSLLFALTALPLNRLLEGYTLPTPIQRHFRRRQVRRMLRFRRTWERTQNASRTDEARSESSWTCTRWNGGRFYPLGSVRKRNEIGYLFGAGLMV